MLQPRIGQRRAEGKAKGVLVAKFRPEKLPAVGCEANGAVEATMHREGMAPVLRLILPVHDHRPADCVRRDEMIDILRDVSLVVHQEAAPAEADVLD